MRSSAIVYTDTFERRNLIDDCKGAFTVKKILSSMLSSTNAFNAQSLACTLVEGASQLDSEDEDRVLIACATIMEVLKSRKRKKKK